MVNFKIGRFRNFNLGILKMLERPLKNDRNEIFNL